VYGRLSVPIRASNIRLLASNAERVQKADGSVGRGAKGQGPAQTVALKEEAIPHTVISNCTSHFFLVNTLGNPRSIRLASSSDFSCSAGTLEIQTGEIVLELRYLPRSNDRDY